MYFNACSTGLLQKPPSRKKFALILICIPVSPGNSRLIWSFPRNFGLWIDKIVPRWIFHIGQNLILDSDLYLLHVQVISIHLQSYSLSKWLIDSRSQYNFCLQHIFLLYIALSMKPSGLIFCPMIPNITFNL